jgi:hypothetical protein
MSGGNAKTNDRFFSAALVLALLVAASGLAGCSSSSGGSGGGGGAPSCDAKAVDGVEVQRGDPIAFPSYAVDGCSLAYVSRAGDLRLRDLATGHEDTLAPASEAPRRPAIHGVVVAWEATSAGASVVRFVADGAPAVTVDGDFDHAGEPRAADDAVVFTAFATPDDQGDTDVMLVDVGSGAVSLVGGGVGQQRFADVSATHVAYTDFAEDPDGRFDGDGTDLADVVVVERATGHVTRRAKPGKQAFPMLGANGALAYLDWSSVHPEPKFQAYDIEVASIDAAPAADALLAHVQTVGAYVRPTASGALVDWIAQDDTGASALLRRPTDLSTAAERAASLSGFVSVGPAATGAFTVVSEDQSGGGVLHGIAR